MFELLYWILYSLCFIQEQRTVWLLDVIYPVSLQRGHSNLGARSFKDNPAFFRISIFFCFKKESSCFNFFGASGFLDVSVDFIADIETEVITLTGNYIPNTTNEINEISLNSPLGMALFKAKIGTSTSYFVGNSEIFITILEKLNN